MLRLPCLRALRTAGSRLLASLAGHLRGSHTQTAGLKEQSFLLCLFHTHVLLLRARPCQVTGRAWGLAGLLCCCSAAQGPAPSVWGPITFCAGTSAAAFALAASASDERERSISEVDRLRQQLGKPCFSLRFSAAPTGCDPLLPIHVLARPAMLYLSPLLARHICPYKAQLRVACMPLCPACGLPADGQTALCAQAYGCQRSTRRSGCRACLLG